MTGVRDCTRAMRPAESGQLPPTLTGRSPTLTGSSWPRTSPSGFVVVAAVTYHLPALSSAHSVAVNDENGICISQRNSPGPMPTHGGAGNVLRGVPMVEGRPV